MQPLYALWDMLPNEKIEDYILKGIQIAPLAFARKNLDNAFVILTKRKHDAFPNENVPNVWEKCKIYGYW
jgi:hypothetical protein